jgi:CheY-like chemotaxis protein
VPDLIISDIMLDNANGFIIRQELQENPITKNIPYIFMTGAADVAGAWGADDTDQYLIKPFSAVELMEAIRKQIG